MQDNPTGSGGATAMVPVAVVAELLREAGDTLYETFIDSSDTSNAVAAIHDELGGLSRVLTKLYHPDQALRDATNRLHQRRQKAAS